jgi:hypothetical protein
MFIHKMVQFVKSSENIQHITSPYGHAYIISFCSYLWQDLIKHMINNFSLDFEFNSSLEEQVKNVEKGMGKVNESPRSAPMKEAVKQSVGYLTYLVSIGKPGDISDNIDYKSS